MQSSKVKELCEDFFEWRLREFPEFATFCGYHNKDRQLNDHSAEAFQRRVTEVEDILGRAINIENSSDLSDDDVANLFMLKYELKMFLEGTKDGDPRGYLFAISYIDGIHIDFEQLVSWMKFETVDDYQIYLDRLKALPDRVRSDLELLREAVSVGRTHSIYSMDAVPKQLNKLINVEPEDSVFFVPFKSTPVNFNTSDIDLLKQQAIAEIKDHILPAFSQLSDYVNQKYLSACRPREGIDSIPGGSEFYQKCLKWHTSLNVTPRQVHDIGMAEVERIMKEMERVIRKSGFVGSFAEFLHHLRTDPKFYFKAKEDCLAGFKNICYDKIRPALPKLFPKIPQSQLEQRIRLSLAFGRKFGGYWKQEARIIKAVPETRAAGTFAYYMNGTLDGARPGIFYVNIHNLSNCAIKSKESAMLCNLLKGMYSIESSDMPRFRRYMEDMYYSNAPSKFPIHTAFCEGWALYCEHLGYELELYDDPFSEFGHLTYEMFRACRLVADTGLHAFGWTFEQAVKLFMDNTAFTEEEIRQEIRRYITWPAQACAYKLGQLKIAELRRGAQLALGEKFDVRTFHDELLRCGLVPLEFLEETVQRFIKSHRDSSKE